MLEVLRWKIFHVELESLRLEFLKKKTQTSTMKKQHKEGRDVEKINNARSTIKEERSNSKNKEKKQRKDQ